jgi:hypothetical protein
MSALENQWRTVRRKVLWTQSLNRLCVWGSDRTQVTEWYALCQSLNISPKVERVLQKNKRLRFDLICASIGETDVLLRQLKRLGWSRHWYVRPHILL